MYTKYINDVNNCVKQDSIVRDLFTVDDIVDAVNRLKLGKAPGFDGIVKEHIVHAHPSIFVHLQLLFNMVYVHGYVPEDFDRGLTVPVPKDKLGDLTSAQNYRPITLSPTIAKLFEHCIVSKFANSISSHELQFGFKNKSSCAQAIFVLQQVCEYFVSCGSNVYIATLDASKAFDRVNHVKLFNILLEKGLPGQLIRVIMDWYSKSFF